MYRDLKYTVQRWEHVPAGSPASHDLRSAALPLPLRSDERLHDRTRRVAASFE
jgi:hypothetical protein